MPISERARLQVEEWRKRLIDLTKRNQLIYFSPSRKSILEIEHPDHNTIFDSLVDEKELDVWLPEEESDEETLEEQQEFSNTILNKPDQKDYKKERLKENEVSFTLNDRKQIEKRLKAISRKAQTDYNEKGIWTSVIVLGLLHWKETSTEEEILSPLIVIPVVIAQANPSKPFKISLADEEILLNPALRVKLNRDCKIELPPLNFDSESFNLDEYVSSVESLGKRDSWKIEQRLFLGANFSFHKIPIYQDLGENAANLVEHSIIKGLIEGYVSEQKDAEDIPLKEDLDKCSDPKKMLYILDADSSQSQAIEAARKGNSFVLKGPPGTGKSQTIANIIAEFLEEGRTVLFVSEKIAALEVVFERLKGAGLGDFCFELHSHKANKKEVVNQLMHCLENNPVPSVRVSNAEVETLVYLKKKLNEYILELHYQRDPIELNMYEVFGKLSQLNQFPLVPIQFVDKNMFSPSQLRAMEELIKRMQDDWVVVEEGDSFIWRGFKKGSFTQELAQNLKDMLQRIDNSISSVHDEFKSFTSNIGLESPRTLTGCDFIIRIGKVMINNPAPINSWFTGHLCDGLILEAKEYCELSKIHLQLRNSLLSDFSEDVFALPEGIYSTFKTIWNKAEELLSVDDIHGAVLWRLRENILKFVDKTRFLIVVWLRDVKVIQDYLEISNMSKPNFDRVKQIIEICLLSTSDIKPEKAWLDPVVLKKVEIALDKLEPYCERYKKINSSILLKYSLDIFNFELDSMITDFSGRYKYLLLRIFLPKYYKDVKKIKNVTLSGKVLPSILSDLKDVKEIKLLKEQLCVEFKDFVDLLGIYYNGFDTKINDIKEGCRVAKRIIELVGEFPLPIKIAHITSLSGTTSSEIVSIVEKMQISMQEWEQELEGLSELATLSKIDSMNLPIRQTPMDKLEKWFSDLFCTLNDFNIIVINILNAKKIKSFVNCSEISEQLKLLTNLRTFEDRIKNDSVKLVEEFGDKFKGIDTNWQDIMDALSWASNFVVLTRENVFSDNFMKVVISGVRTTSEEVLTLETALKEAKMAIGDFQSNFNNNCNFFSPVSFNTLSFDEMKKDVEVYESKLLDLRYWFDYAAVVSSLDNFGLIDFTKKLVLSRAKADTLHKIFLKSLYSAWVNIIFKEVPVFKDFRGDHHDKVIKEFRELDKKLSHLSAALIIQNLNERKPKILDIAGSAVSVIRKESAKKRRHLPVRMLLDRISELLLKIKPCLLMSPLSVSSYLNSKQFRFDLVIFDEASQICSEDAIGSIYRGKQLIVAGDNQQLPPTKFFQSESLEDEEFEEGSSEPFDVYQSVLDDCGRIGLKASPLMLKWHYRSKHEGLIAYSNSKFYESKLITFPCAKENDCDLGVKFEYVKDGIFDRGGRRDNIKEAEYVADLVLDHFRKFGNKKTVGVATLNIPQRDAIMDALWQKRKQFPELEKFFVDDRLSGFFVKNLESVQGDERDIIVLSLGYGRDSQGRFTMNFGPINKEGGERRLNVVVTRAKEKLILVSSIKASDFKLGELNSAGIRHLYHYLDYAERGKVALEIDDILDGEVDSLFEEDVKNEIKIMGYDVISQVGCSGFRIDLGVIDSTKPGCFILGIECDGATYHSAFTARERDRIRQDVLESLGWRIHRIWSPDWFFTRGEEIEKLKFVIEESKLGDHCAKTIISEYNQFEVSYEMKKCEHINGGNIKGIENYKYYNVSFGKSYPSYEFKLEDSEVKRMRVLAGIVERETPIHVGLATRRLLSVWGIARAGHIIEETMDRTIKECQREKCVFKKGDFLWANRGCTVIIVRRPIDGDEDTFRDPEYVCSEELELAMLIIIENSLGINKDALFTETERLFGWKRATSVVETMLFGAFTQLKKDKKITINDKELVYRNKS